MVALALAAALCPAPARAGYYAVTYTGSISGGPSYSPTGTPWPGSGSCNGSGTLTIQGTATWTNNQGPHDTAPPPAGLIVEEGLNAAPTGNGPPGGTATANDGFHDGPGATATPVIQNGVETGVTYAGSSMGIRWSAPSTTGASVALTSRSLSVTVTPIAGSNPPSAASVFGYNADVFPVVLGLGGATQDSSGNLDILVGQRCTPSLSIGESIDSRTFTGTLSNFQWSATGTTFQSWTINSNPAPGQDHTTYVANPSPNTAASPSWYWNDLSQQTETITCTATVTPPTGQGSPFSVTATQKVTVMVPLFSATGVGGYMRVGQFRDGGYYLFATPNTPLNGGGMNWEGVDETPTSPVFGPGRLELVQIAIPNVSYVKFSTGVNDADPENNQVGLDKAYPYGGIVSTEPIWDDGDSPQLVLQNGNSPVASSAQMTHQFQDTFMYQPPNSGQWVPMATFNWSTNGNAAIPATNNWADYTTAPGSNLPGQAGTVSPSTGQFTPTNIFPSWGLVDVFPTF